MTETNDTTETEPETEPETNDETETAATETDEQSATHSDQPDATATENDPRPGETVVDLSADETDEPRAESETTAETDPATDAAAAQNAERGHTPPDNDSGRTAATETAGRHAGAQQASQVADDYDAEGEAKRLLQNVDGESAAERASVAIDHVRTHLKQLSERLSALRQRESKTESRVDDLRDSKLHLQRAPDTEQVIRSFGGVSISVPPAGEYDDPTDDDRVPTPPGTVDERDADRLDWDGVYDRDDFLRDIVDTLDDTQNELASIQEEHGKVERGIGRAEQVLNELHDFREKSEWVTDTSAAHQNQQAQSQPPAQGQRQPRQQGQAAAPETEVSGDPRGHTGHHAQGHGQHQRQSSQGAQTPPVSRRQQLDEFTAERNATQSTGVPGEGGQSSDRDHEREQSRVRDRRDGE